MKRTVIALSSPRSNLLSVILVLLSMLENYRYRFAIAGGGSGGIAIAAKLAKKYGKGKVVIIEPSSTHYYQPLFTLVGGGLADLPECTNATDSLIPPGCTLLKDEVKEFQPKQNCLVTGDGHQVHYEYLVMATGIALNYDKVEGLTEALEYSDNVCTNYSPEYVRNTYYYMKNMTKGNALFTFPTPPIKCAGAPQKIMYLADAHWRNEGVRDNINIQYYTALGVLFGVKKFADALNQICDERNLTRNYQRNLVKIDHVKKIATFEDLSSENRKREDSPYDFIHVTPPMGPQEAVKDSELADSNGYVDVDKHTLQHVRYPNVFGIGDCTNTPNGKTVAAVAAQLRALYKNLKASVAGTPLKPKYDGYAACPLVTGNSKLILAEFDYDNQPLETFPFDQSEERYSMYLMKKYFLPPLYWKSLLKGTWLGPKEVRKGFQAVKRQVEKVA
ncbi:uncharacterized protein TRIADDRAFT_49680 [Trichoplax adhaerens]|uniref:Sulfide:quinone oxidoreductase, mitochondrial n=1 Tax=Trichoplax adhaerens TaxID=10228 RepID=B3RLI1_TRIAD|nr:hypothetical protein TRIADDRAFT_49680 [Trichoplax adhaerens]EDV28776.1 hypothetical protein TRIADDRAFT_49680 [Trichoplax adhaerens]|eukprot:XP_002107978.1 hypothetical protein TRIADDRAFT_49680 [Trichoplax adhaerens]